MFLLGGLCHRSEITDDGDLDDATDRFTVGDVVLVKVLDVDRENYRLSFTMKPSCFTEAEIEGKFVYFLFFDIEYLYSC